VNISFGAFTQPQKLNFNCVALANSCGHFCWAKKTQPTRHVTT